LVIPVFIDTKKRAEDSARRALFAEILKRLDEYVDENDTYPESLADLNVTQL